MGKTDRPYIFHTHTCLHRSRTAHPDFCYPNGTYRRRLTSKLRRRDARRIIAASQES